MWHFIVLAISVQLVLFISIFDIYFTSPIIHGIHPITNNIPTKCNRVVVISVDGLRLDALLEDEVHVSKKVAPYINKIITSKGAFGISRTHLPTESRPGHVAMLAGFYEDPSAITKGWKENPVEFDSIFNRSACSFSWGSPDIVDIFYKGLIHNCSHKWTYSNQQDFAGNTMALDNWVRNEIDIFFRTVNPQAYSLPQTLFFFHLLGQDTSGHTHKPKTERYRENLRNVDSIVQHIDDLFARKFLDNKTCFVLSSDHGMTDWGSHGAGDPSETETPIVAWGSGIRRSSELKHIDQADITPLLAVLLGVPIPVNSVGLLPSAFLNVSTLIATEAKLLNARQICEQLIAKHTEMESKRSFLMYKEYKVLDPSKISTIIDSIRVDINRGNIEVANEKIKYLLDKGFEGLKFFQSYFQKPLFFVTTLSYCGWIACILLILLSRKPVEVNLTFYVVFVILLVCVGGIVFKASLPYTYVVFSVLPVLLWLRAFPRLLIVREAIGLSVNHLIKIVTFFIGIELLVLGFFYRWVYSVLMFFIVIWPFVAKIKQNHLLIMFWTISGLALATFTLLPVIGKQPSPSLTLAGSSLLFLFSAANIYEQSPSKSSLVLGVLRTVGIAVAGANNYYVHSNFSENFSSPMLSQELSWGILLLTLLLLTQPSDKLLDRFSNTLATLSLPFILLSISHEVFFYLALLVHVSCWVKLEMLSSDVFGSSIHYRQYLRPKLRDDVSLSDFRQGYFFLTYIVVAFFGIGNLATVNSFDPAWVRCFLTTFSPFTMTALILLKVVIPFMLVTLALRVHTLMQGVRPNRIFLIILIYCNVMGLNFLFLVRNEGSWLDIGTTLSHYVIQQVTIVFVLILFFVAQIIIPFNDSKTAKLFPKSN